MTYQYKAMDVTGQEVQGIVEASSYDEAVHKIRQRGLFVTKVIPDDYNPIPDAKHAVERARRCENRVATTQARLRLSYLVMLLAAVNCAGTFIPGRNIYYSLAGIAISFCIIGYCIWSVRQSRKSIRESQAAIEEMRNEHAAATRTP